MILNFRNTVVIVLGPESLIQIAFENNNNVVCNAQMSIRKNFRCYQTVLVQGIIVSLQTICLWGFQIVEKLKREWIYKLFIFQGEIFCRAGKKAGLISLKSLKMETFFFRDWTFTFETSVCKSNTEGRRKFFCRVKILWLLEIQYSYEANCSLGCKIKWL